MDYELYHDESKIDGYWHGMLLVPVDQKKQIVELLCRARDVCKYQDPMGIKHVKKRKRVFNCARAWMNIAFAALRTKTNGVVCPICFGNWDNIETHPSCTLAKFILFREKDNFQNLQNYSDYGAKVETTFRFGLKGGVHSLFDDNSAVFITKLHFDGHEHYARHVDKDRIIGRLQGLRAYFSISDQIDDRSSNHNLLDSQNYEDCQLLQLTDLLIGCFRSELGHSTKPLHLVLAAPVKDYLRELGRGYARMRNSRWFNSIWLSQCYLYQGKWFFEPLEIEYKDPFVQQSIF